MNLRYPLITLSVVVLAALSLGGSCASSNGGGYEHDDHYGSDYKPNRIPRNADLVREGSGKVKWTADLDGSIYIYDVQDDHIVYTGPVRRSQEIVVVPDDDKIYVAERVVYNQNLRRNGVHQVYFARERKGNEGDRPQGGGLPHNAQRIERGRGDLAIHAASRDGTVYVYDEDDRRVLYSAELRRGNSFQIFTAKDYVNINSKRAASVRFERGHTHGLYFK